jgi:predicted nucleic acid-binding protein
LTAVGLSDFGEETMGIMTATEFAKNIKKTPDRLRKKPRINIDEMTGLIFGRLSAFLRKKGLDHQYRVQDLWLAAQAVQNNLRLLTRNEKAESTWGRVPQSLIGCSSPCTAGGVQAFSRQPVS